MLVHRAVQLPSLTRNELHILVDSACLINPFYFFCEVKFLTKFFIFKILASLSLGGLAMVLEAHTFGCHFLRYGVFHHLI